MSGRRRRPCPRIVSTDPVPRSFPDSLRRFLGVSLGPGNPEGTGARIGARGDLQLRLAVGGIILGDDDYLLVIWVLPGMKGRPGPFPRGGAWPGGQQVALSRVLERSG